MPGMNILYLVHRIPFPPDKGDKIRSYRWLTHLAKDHNVHLVTLVDHEDDLKHISDVEQFCATVHAFRLRPMAARIKALLAVPGQKPLSLPYFFHRDARRAVRRLSRDVPLDLAFVYSSSMCQYLDDVPGLPCLLDMVDVDSAKFQRYGELGSGPKAWIYRLEGERLARYEEEQVERCRRVLLVTEPEAELLRRRVALPERVQSLGNGIDPPRDELLPGAREGADLVFVGAMDYEPNVDAVEFAARDVLPLIHQRRPDARLVIVGRDPAERVRRLGALSGVKVTGAVPSIGSYLRHARLSLVPLRIAQGIQNKVLEAMAWALPVVTNRRIAVSMEKDTKGVLCAAETAQEYADQVVALLNDPERADALGRRARAFVREHFAWQPRLDELDRVLVDAAREDVR